MRPPPGKHRDAPRVDTVGLALAFRHEFGRGTEFVDITEPPSKVPFNQDLKEQLHQRRLFPSTGLLSLSTIF